MFNKNNFKHEVENSTNPVLVDFFATWCGPCQMMAPIIDEMVNEYKDKGIKIGKLNIDENQEIAFKYNVMSIPTFLIFKNGKVVAKKAGYCNKEELIQLIDQSK